MSLLNNPLLLDQGAVAESLQAAKDQYQDALIAACGPLDDLTTGWLLAQAARTARKVVGWILIVDGEKFFLPTAPRTENRHLWAPVFADIATAAA